MGWDKTSKSQKGFLESPHWIQFLRSMSSQKLGQHTGNRPGQVDLWNYA